MSDSQALSSPDPDGLTPEEAAICDHLTNGYTKENACAMVGISFSTLWRWQRKKPAFEKAVACAYENGGELAGERLLTLHERIEDNGKLKVASENLRFILARRHSKLFSEKVEVNQTSTLSIISAREQAYARTLRPSCDPVPAIDVEYADVSITYESKPTDKQSEAPLSVSPDIFT